MSSERLTPEPRAAELVALEEQESAIDRSNAPPSSEAAQLLQAEIALTRQRVASEVDAIAEKIKPENIKREIVRSLRERALAALELARHNPVPVAVACGAAVLLLVWRARARHA